MGGQRHAPAALPPGKRPGTHCAGEWVGSEGQSGRMRKISPSPEFDPRTVQPVASHDTAWAIPAHTLSEVPVTNTELLSENVNSTFDSDVFLLTNYVQHTMESSYKSQGLEA